MYNGFMTKTLIFKQFIQEIFTNHVSHSVGQKTGQF